MKNLLWLLILLTGTAQAQFYGIAGFGKSQLIESRTDNDFHQNGFGDMTEDRSNAWKLGVGYKLSRNFAFEVDYRDLGQFNQTSMYVSDLGGEGHYNGHGCNGECEATSISYQHGTTKGIGASFLAYPDWNVAPFIRAGAFWHSSKFYSAQKFGSLPTQKQFGVFHDNAEAPDYKTPFRSEGLNAMVGAGIRAGMFDVEYTYYSKVQSWCAPYQNISSLMVSVRMDF